jgi:hypothetical protein
VDLGPFGRGSPECGTHDPRRSGEVAFDAGSAALGPDWILQLNVEASPACFSIRRGSQVVAEITVHAGQALTWRSGMYSVDRIEQVGAAVQWPPLGGCGRTGK